MANTSGIRAGRAYVELGVSDQLTKGLKQAQAQLNAFGAGLQSLGKGLMAGGGAALAFMAGATKVFSEGIHELLETSERTGASVEALSELEFAASRAGLQLDGLEVGLRKMQKTVGEAAMGSASASEALGKLGLTAADLTKLAPDQQFELLADRLDQIRDPALRAAMAMEIFGKSGTSLLPMMAGGAAGLTALRQEARTLGLTVSTETAESAAQLKDALKSLWMVGGRLYATIGEALAPAVTQLAGAATRVVVSFMEWIRQNQQVIVTSAEVAAAVFGVGAALYAVGFILTRTIALGVAVKAAVVGVSAALSSIAMIAAGLLSPLGAVLVAVAGLGTYLVLYSQAGGQALSWLSDRFRDLLWFVGRVMEGVSQALSAGDVALASKVLWAGIKVEWQKGVLALESIWDPIKEQLVTTWNDVWYSFAIAVENAASGLKRIWNSVTSAMTSLWIEAVGLLSSVWTGFVNGVGRAWDSVQEWLINRWIDLYRIVGGLSQEQAAALKRMNQEDYALQDAFDAESYQKRMKAIESERGARERANREQEVIDQQNEQALHDQKIANLVARWRIADAAAKAARGAGVAAAQAELQRAQDALDAALAQARSASTLAGAPSAPELPKLPTQADLDAILTRQRKISVMSTYDVSATFGFGATSAKDETVEILKRMDKRVQRIEAKTGGALEP